MIRNRQQADNHVTEILKHLKSEKERLFRGFQFAKIYYDIKEFGRAKEYLTGFLSLYDNVAAAYKLLGQIHEELNARPQDIIAAYRRSLDLDPQQHHLIVKICELYTQIEVSPKIASIWLAKLEKCFPNHALIFKMKSKCIQSNGEQGNANQDMIKFYETELAKDSSHPGRCISLLKLYLAEEQKEMAYKKILDMELLAQPEYTSSLEWYRLVDSFLEDYKKNESKDEMEKMLRLVVLMRILMLTIATTINFMSYVNILWSLDQELKLYQNNSSTIKSDVFCEVLKEAEAHYFFFAAILLFNKAQKDRLFWSDASTIAFTCLLISNNYNIFDNKQQNAGVAANIKIFLKSIENLFSLRLSQTGHMLHKRYGEQDSYNILQGHVLNYLTIEAKRKLVEVLFTSNNKIENALDDSFMIKYNFYFQIPDTKILSHVDKDVQLAFGSDLNILVWICLHYYNDEPIQPQYPFDLKSNLRYSCERWDVAAAETLNQLDLQLFLLLTVKFVKEQLALIDAHVNEDKPLLFPILINGKLPTESQISWWSAAHQLSKNKTGYETFGQLRWTIQQGLETIRMVGLNKLPLTFVNHLAMTLEDRLNKVCGNEFSITNGDSNGESKRLSPMKINGLESLVNHFWEKAVSIASKPDMESYYSSIPQKAKLFESKQIMKPLSDEERQLIVNRGSLFQSKLLAKQQQYQQALLIIEKIKTPEARLQASKVFVMLSETNRDNEYENLNDTKSKYLDNARKTLLDVLEDYKSDRHNPIYFEVLNEIDEVEKKIDNHCSLHENQSLQVERTPTRLNQRLFPSHNGSNNQLYSSTPLNPNQSAKKNESTINQDRPDIQWRFYSDMMNNMMQSINIMKEEIRENRITIQKLQEKCTSLELKQLELDQKQQQQQQQPNNSFPSNASNYLSNSTAPFYQLQPPHFPIRPDFDLQRSLFQNRELFAPQFFQQPLVPNLVPNIVPPFGSPAHRIPNLYQNIQSAFPQPTYDQQDENDEYYEEEAYLCQTTNFREDEYFNIVPTSAATQLKSVGHSVPLKELAATTLQPGVTTTSQLPDKGVSAQKDFTVTTENTKEKSSLADILKSATDEILTIKNKDKSKDHKKEKSTDCDSALIPLRCVHG